MHEKDDSNMQCGRVYYTRHGREKRKGDRASEGKENMCLRDCSWGNVGFRSRAHACGGFGDGGMGTRSWDGRIGYVVGNILAQKNRNASKLNGDGVVTAEREGGRRIDVSREQVKRVERNDEHALVVAL